MMKIVLPIPLLSPNRKEHWSKTYKRNSMIKFLVALKFKGKVGLPCIVRIVRHCKRFMDEDNFIFACKAIRDAIADRLIPGLAAGRADGDNRITWVYEQVKDNEIYVEIIIDD